MYFCCQGGDGAHTGHAHSDFVNIGVAWFFVGIVSMGMLFVSMMPGDY